MSRHTRIKTVRYIVIALMIAVLHVFQIVFAHRLTIAGVKPFILTPAVICAAMYLSQGEGAVFSLILGLSCDAVSGGLFGKYALLMTVLACTVYYLCESVTRKGAVAALMFHGVLYVLMTVYVIFMRFLIVGDTSGLWTRLWNMWIEGAYSIVFAVPVYLIFKYMTRKFALDE